jgi:PAS domain S-box-containing protein
MRQQKRIQGRQGLQLDEQSLQLLVETIPALMWRAKPDGQIDYVNKRLLEYFGSPLEEIIGWGWMEKVHPDDVAFKVQTWLSDLEATTSHDVNCRFQGADGAYRWFNIRGEPLRNSDGSVQNWYGVFIDIDNQKKAEEKSRESELKLRQITETVPGLVWSNGPDGEPTHINQRMLDCSGMPFEEFRHRGWEAFVHPADYPETAEAFWHAIQTGTSYQGVMRLRRADGEFRWHDARCEPLRDREGRIIQWYGLSVDIDDAKKAEGRLRHSEAHLTEAQKLSHTGSWVYDATTMRYLYWSDECYRIWGFDPLQGLPSRESMWQRIYPDDRDRVWETLQEVLRQKNNLVTEFRILLPDGTIKYLEATSYHVFSPLGALVEAITTHVDVTERKRAEQALRESEAKFRDFAETASDWFCEMGPDYKFTLLSENAFGSGAADRIGTACWDHALDLDTEPEKWRLLQETVFSRKPFRDFVYCGMSSDGSPMYVRASGKPLFDANGEFRGYRGTCSDVTEITRAQEALRESERRSRSAIDGIAGLVAIMAPNGELDALNRQGIEYFGRSFEEMKNWGTSDAVHPEDLPRIAEIFKRSLVTSTPFHYELRLRRFDGEYRWFDNRGVPTREKSGRIVGWYILGTDIEERKRAEEALRESETKFRDYAESASDWYWESDPDHKFTRVTDSERILAPGFGLARWEYATDVESEPEKWELHRSMLEARQPFRDFVYRAPRDDGSLMYIKTSGKPIYDAKGAFLGYRGTGTDVTALMHAQEALRESERSLRSAIDGIPGLVAVLAPNGELETVNRPLFEYFGQPLEWLKNWGTNDAVHPEDLPRVVEIFGRAVASGLPFQLDQRQRCIDGEYRWFETRGVPIRDDSGHIVRWYVLLTDIEDRTRARAQLEQMQSDFAHMNRVSMMGELAASLSHEITQPIASARNNARAAQNFLDMQPPDLSEVREALGCVVGDTDRAGDIVDRIRDHIKKTPPRKEHFDLNEAINEVIVLARSAIVKNRVWVQTRLSERLCPVHGDRVQLQQVVLNLILNAVEAMGSVEAAPRDLLISTSQDHAGVLVAVHDSGPGIRPAHLERVFNSFYTTKPGGTGMGLSICRSIIDAHGGRLWTEVNEPRGAIFQFTLPAVQVGP